MTLLLRLLLVTGLLAPAGDPSGSRPGVAATPTSPLPADTVLRPDLSRLPAAVRAGLAASPDEPHVRLGLRRIPVGERVGERAPPPPLPPGVPDPSLLRRIRGPRLTPLPPLRAPELVDALLRAQARRVGAGGASRAVFLPPLTPRQPAVPPAPEGQEGPPRFRTEYADLALNVTSRMELGGAWTRFRPCDEQFRVSCNPNLIPQLSPDTRFGVQVEGTIADRVRVDVDFDQSREFDAANRINIFYEGAEDDVLRRLDVGDVTFALPRSRFLTEGIPAGNFGFQAEGQLGPLDFQAVWAQQRGDVNSRVFRLTGVGDQRTFVQDDTLALDDADYVRGQFFFVVDPARIDDYPHIDVLDLDASSAPAPVAPGVEPIQLYRFEADPVFRQQVEGYIQADAVAEKDGVRVVESGWFRYLQPGVDYFVHPSGLWVALRAPLARDEMLAVTYITAVGDTVGDYNPERIHNLGGRPVLKLLKASGANHQPGRPTWDYEMHQVYRVSSSPDVEEGSVDLVVSLGEPSAGRTFKRAPDGRDITYLRLMGVDEEAPIDALDPAFVYTPARELFQDQPPVQGTFVVFPTLRPFLEPPPVPSLGLEAEDTRRILGEDANARIYEEVDPFERENAGRFRLTLSYRLRSQGVISSFSLGAFGIRDGSERIYLGDRLLVRGVDYQIDYDVGQVTLLEPEALFASAPEAAVRATWEQRSLFQVSPTQVFGFRTHTALGERGGLDVLGLYRSERTVVTRPILGTEPGAVLLGGVSGSIETDIDWFDRILDGVPGLRPGGQSTFSVRGELAASLPNPNTRGRAFLDDFDATAQLPVSLLASEWVRGSPPSRRDGAEGVLPPSLTPANAASLVWQHRWVVESILGDSVGVHEGFFPRTDLDRQIRLAGAELREPGLLVSFGGSRDGTPAWRSMTTALSPVGLDLTKTEFIEFYAAGGEELTLVLDLGTVSEDAFFLDDAGNPSGVRAADGKPWGQGILDLEADPRRGEIWSDEADDRGVWDESCRAERGRIYRVGDPRAICTRGNGRQDGEDLDQDGNLDVLERHLRYVVRLDGSSPFLVRSRQETGTDFQLYRIPLRGPGAVEVGGPITDADLRAVRHLRLTAVGTRPARVRIARLRLVGSRWIKRASEGVLRGIGGDTLAAFGRVEVRSVSRVTDGAAYTSPPGVLEELADPTSAFAGQAIEFNEKSLGLSFDELPQGARAEVYHRFTQRPRNFLAYREARVWVVPLRGDFGPERPHYFFLKVGTDSDNFYLFRTRLRTPPPAGAIEAEDWLPEIRVDFDEWIDLRRRAEETLLLDPPAPGDPPVTVWAADSSYAVVLSDRGRAPNLAAVREMSLGVWNEGELPLSGEVWIDELRLGRPVRDAGVAASLEMELDGAGVVTSRLSYSDRGAFFRQLRDDPSYQTDRRVRLTTELAADRWLPAAWGVEIPVTLEVDRRSRAPRFLARSDIRADRLRNLRDTRDGQTRVGLSFRKRTASLRPWLGILVDGLSGRIAYQTSDGSSVASTYEAEGLEAGLAWTRSPEARTIPLVPSGVRAVARTLLPAFLEDRVLGARLRWTPERVSFGTSYSRLDTRIRRFERIIEVPEDSTVEVTRAPREGLVTAADVRLRPLPPLTADVALQSVRDLLPTEDVVSDAGVQTLVDGERARPGGLDLGWETNRSLLTRVGFRPSLLSWLDSDFTWTTRYRSGRNAGFVDRRIAGGDTTLVLTRNANAERDWRAAFTLDPDALAASWLGEAQPGESAGVHQLRGALTALQPVSLAYQAAVRSRFHREPVRPGAAYQLGLGGARDFLELDGDTAATWTHRTTWTIRSGAHLPGDVSMTLGFQETDAVTLDTRSDRRMTQRRWPDVAVLLPPLELPSWSGVQTLALSAGVVRTHREIEFGGRGVQRRSDQVRDVPLSVTLRWRGTLVTAYQLRLRDGRGEDPTGDTQRTERTHRFTVSSRFLPPGGLAERLDRPVRFALVGLYRSERSCRATAARPECVEFVDQIARSLNLSLDTSASGFEFGAQLSFDDRRSFVGRRSGSTQFQLMLFGQLRFNAGTIRPIG